MSARFLQFCKITLIALLLSIAIVAVFEPSLVHAQGAPDVNAPDANIAACNSYNPLKIGLCWFERVMIFLLSATIYALGSILFLIDKLFNFILDYTVIQYGTSYGYWAPALNTLWSVGRDLANIIIIGLFMYIAISLILGLEEFGQKKLIARVLIIAVLINFSFLFTRMIINVSNVLAIGIYTSGVQTAMTNVAPNDPTARTTAVSGPGDQFLKLLRVGTWQETTSSMRQMYNKTPSWGISVLILHTAMSAVLIFGASLSLLYGAVLLIGRFITLSMLLMFSSLAFATWLLPTYAESDFGWRGWWQRLLKAALLAPFFMFALTITLQLGKAMQQNTALQGSVGNLVAEKGFSDPAAIGALLNYLIIVGIMFAGTLISGSLAGAASRKWATRASLGAASRAVGTAGRFTVGWGAEKRAMALKEKIDRQGYATAGDMLKMRAYKSLSKSSFEMANTKLGQGIVKTFGGGVNDKAGKGGFDAYAQGRAKQALADAKALAPDNKNRENLATKAQTEKTKQVEETQTKQRDTIKDEREKLASQANEKGKNAADTHRNDAAQITRAQTAKAERDKHQDELSKIEQQKNTVKQQYEQAIKDADTRINTARKANNQTEIDAANLAKTNLMTQFNLDTSGLDKRATEAQAEIKRHNEELANIEKEAEQKANDAIAAHKNSEQFKEATKALNDQEKELNKTAKEAGEVYARTLYPDEVQRAAQYSLFMGRFLKPSTDPNKLLKYHPLASKVTGAKKKTDEEHILHVLHDQMHAHGAHGDGKGDGHGDDHGKAGGGNHGPAH